jgi:hypothetical protein
MEEGLAKKPTGKEGMTHEKARLKALRHGPFTIETEF